MAKVLNMDNFKKITSNITSFSHAYLFNVNSLEAAYPYIKEFAKEIILGKNYNIDDNDISNISYQIDNDEFDDLYIVNPKTIGINTDEINKLMSYMDRKSLYDDGKRVYIIYGFERLTRDVSNKILKFLEEPSENIYALLITENFEKILPTIISRCQTINLTIDNQKIDEDKVKLLIDFLNKLVVENKKMITYIYDYFKNDIRERAVFYEDFEILEKIISNTLNNKYRYGNNKENIYICERMLEYSDNTLINILNITNKLKCLIKNNINLNLLLDRYIIEVTEELVLCKK